MRSAFTWAGVSLCSVLPRPTAILAHGLQKERVLCERSDAQSHKAHTCWGSEKCWTYREVLPQPPAGLAGITAGLSTNTCSFLTEDQVCAQKQRFCGEPIRSAVSFPPEGLRV